MSTLLLTACVFIGGYTVGYFVGKLKALQFLLRLAVEQGQHHGGLPCPACGGADDVHASECPLSAAAQP